MRTLEKALNQQLARQHGFWLRVPFQDVRNAFQDLAWHTRAQENKGAVVQLPLAPLDFSSHEYGGREHTLLASLSEAVQEAGTLVQHCLVHGSLASRDFTFFSDVDALLIVPDEVFVTPSFFAHSRRVIRRFLREILAYDPLQHHGFHIIPASGLRHYPEAYLPLTSLAEARVLGKACTLTFARPAEPDLEERRKSFKRMLHTLLSTGRRPGTLYDAKLFLSSFMLLPALALQAEGEEISKKHSFTKYALRFSRLEWEAMVWATRIRAEWPKTELSSVERGALAVANPWLVSRLLLRRRPLPISLTKIWTQKRHEALMKFLQLAGGRTTNHQKTLLPSASPA